MVATLADSTQTRIKSSVTGTCMIEGKPTNCTFLAIEQMGHEIILGMDILEALGLQLSLNGLTTNPTLSVGDQNVCTVGISELTKGKKKSVDEFIAEEKKLFDTITGPTHLTSYRVKLKDSTPLKQRYRPSHTKDHRRES